METKKLVKAGLGIEAGSGIEAGLQIQCGKLESGTVCFGELVEIGLPKEKPVKPVTTVKSGTVVKVTIDGKDFDAVIK